MALVVAHEVGRIVDVRFRCGWFGKCIVQICREEFIVEEFFDLSAVDISVPVRRRRSLGRTPWEDLDCRNIKDLMEATRFCKL
jgi:hypothetical protein